MGSMILTQEAQNLNNFDMVCMRMIQITRFYFLLGVDMYCTWSFTTHDLARVGLPVFNVLHDIIVFPGEYYTFIRSMYSSHLFVSYAWLPYNDPQASGHNMFDVS